MYFTQEIQQLVSLNTRYKCLKLIYDNAAPCALASSDVHGRYRVH